MNGTIWKFPIEWPRSVFRGEKLRPSLIDVPKGSKLLDIQFQGDDVMSWWLCDPKESEQTQFEFYIVGTGWDNAPDLDHMEHNATLQQEGLVWHIFSRPS